MGRTERQKGKRGEREAAKELTRLLGIPFRRTQQFKGTPISADVEGLDGLHIEVKRREKLNFYKALETARDESGDDTPIVLTRRNHKDWVVICYMEDLPQIASIVNGIEPDGDGEGS